MVPSHRHILLAAWVALYSLSAASPVPTPMDGGDGHRSHFDGLNLSGVQTRPRRSSSSRERGGQAQTSRLASNADLASYYGGNASRLGDRSAQQDSLYRLAQFHQGHSHGAQYGQHFSHQQADVTNPYPSYDYNYTHLAEASNREPTYYDLFPQQPQGIAAHNYPGYHAGSSSSYYAPPSSYSNDMFGAVHDTYSMDGQNTDLDLAHHSQYTAGSSRPHDGEQNVPVEQQHGEVQQATEAVDPLARKRRTSSFWRDQGSAIQREILETISKRRGITNEVATKKLAPLLDQEILDDLRSDDLDVVDARINNDLFKLTARSVLPKWKDNMKEEDCERLMQKIHDICKQEKDIIRSQLRHKRITATLAQQLLQSPRSSLATFLVQMELPVLEHVQGEQAEQRQEEPERQEDMPVSWDALLTTDQRRQVIQMVKKAYRCDGRVALGALSRINIPMGLGWKLLHCQLEEEAALLHQLIPYFNH
ncbi:hypothetical protein CBS101457_003025 [Exobasidium rhododendri]|nr:hypothetical protein CBS101457_003025 [Exobasidium rhododendri]